MSVLILPTTADPFQQQTMQLDGIKYVMSLSYNQREERWYLSLADDEGVPLISGLKLRANWPLLWRHRYNVRLPPGEIMAIATTVDKSPPTLLELGEGKRCQLTYFERSTLLALHT